MRGAATERTKTFFAVICCPANFAVGIQHPAAFTGPSKEDLIESALRKRQEMERNGNGPYAIFVGEMTDQVVAKSAYTLEAL